MIIDSVAKFDLLTFCNLFYILAKRFMMANIQIENSDGRKEIRF